MYIKRLQIKNFRSIGTSELFIKDLSILVGGNDAGKSNYLKALNLFFNEETDFKTPFNFAIDFNYFAKIGANKAPEIEIIIDLDVPEGFNFPQLSGFTERTIRWKKVWRKSGIHKDELSIISKQSYTFEEYKVELGKEGKTLSRSKIPEWIKNIRYRYIPAIKSNDYFNALLRELYKVLSEANVTGIQGASKGMIQSINNDTKGFAAGIKENLGVNSEISLPLDLGEFFESLDITTEHFGKKVSMHSRGDGIKTRHIPSLIKYFSDAINNNRDKGSPKISTIWGYEEPENNLEMIKAFDLASEFLDYSKDNIQIFLTTHSPAFYNLIGKDNKNIIGYEIEQNIEHYSSSKEITDTDQIDGKMGILQIITPHIVAAKEENELMKINQIKIQSKLEGIQSELGKLKPKKILIIEDERIATNNLWKKWMDGIFGANQITIWSSKGGNKFDIETSIIHIQHSDTTYKPAIFRQIDRDGYSAAQIPLIEKYYEEKIHNKGLKGKYKFRVLPVCEIENFAILDTHVLPADLDEIKDHLRTTITKHFDEMKGIQNLSDALGITYDSTKNIGKCNDLVNEAKLNPHKFLPGDKIFPTAISVLNSTDIAYLRSELNAFIEEIKVFFNAI